MHEQLEVRARKLASVKAQRAQQQHNEHEMSIRRGAIQLQQEQCIADVERVQSNLACKRMRKEFEMQEERMQMSWEQWKRDWAKGRHFDRRESRVKLGPEIV